MMDSDQNSTLVIIVTYNGMQWLERCLRSVEGSDMELDTFVVDNGSSDGTQGFIARNFPDVHFVQSDKNLGFGKANNLGLEYALANGYDYVYLLNQDAWVMPQTISTMIGVQRKNSRYGVLSPLQTNAEITRLDRNFAMNCIAKTPLVSGFIFNNLEELYDVPFIMAAHWLISRDCLESVGGFSPLFGHYGEDDDFLNRAKYKGFSIGVVPSVVGVHDREHRAASKAHDIRMLGVGFMIVAANINRSFFASFCKATLRLMLGSVMCALKYRDIRIVFRYMFRIFSVFRINCQRKIAKYDTTPFLVVKK